MYSCAAAASVSPPSGREKLCLAYDSFCLTALDEVRKFFVINFGMHLFVSKDLLHLELKIAKVFLPESQEHDGLSRMLSVHN